MKIAHIIATFPPHIGGMGEVCYEEAKGLAERGHSVTVFALRYPNTVYQDESFPFRVIRLRSVLKLGDAGFVPNVFHKLRRFDIIHVHYPFYGGAEWVLLAKILNRQKYVITFHMEAYTQGFIRRTIQTVYDFLAAPFIMRGAEKIIAVDKHHIKQTRLFGAIQKRMWYELPHGVDTTIFRPVSIDWNLMGYEECKNKKILLFVGNLLPLKRLDLLIKALYLLYSKGDTQTVVWVVGGGYAMSEYQTLVDQYSEIKDRIYFLGFCKDKELLVQYYNAAWAVVIPSKTESFSLVMNEARACSVPVVVSRIPGIQERVIPGVDGYIFNSGDEKDLSLQLVELLKLSSVERNQMGLLGRRKVEGFSWKAHLDTLEEWYKDIVYKKQDGTI